MVTNRPSEPRKAVLSRRRSWRKPCLPGTLGRRPSVSARQDPREATACQSCVDVQLVNQFSRSAEGTISLTDCKTKRFSALTVANVSLRTPFGDPGYLQVWKRSARLSRRQQGESWEFARCDVIQRGVSLVSWEECDAILYKEKGNGHIACRNPMHRRLEHRL